MKALQGLLVIALCKFENSVNGLDVDYTQLNKFDNRYLDIKESLDKTIGYAKSVIQSMEMKLLETQKYVSILEEKQKECGQSNLLIEQLQKQLQISEEATKESLIHVKRLEDRLVKSEHDQDVKIESLSRRVVRLEKKLLNIGQLEPKVHTNESANSNGEHIGKIKEDSKNRLLAINQASSFDDNDQNANSLHVNVSAIIKTTNDNGVLYQSKPRKATERKHSYSLHDNDVATNVFRGLRAVTEDHVAFRVSGVSRLEGHHSGERIVYSVLDYSEGGGYDLISGTFTCPITGTYFFAATIGSSYKLYVFAVLKMDGVSKMGLYAGSLVDNMSTAVTIAHCKVGQSVWMEVINGDHLGGWESLSGFLLWSESASS